MRPPLASIRRLGLCPDRVGSESQPTWLRLRLNNSRGSFHAFCVLYSALPDCHPTLWPPDVQDVPGRIPVIYSTDLHHPHIDPDDHFDLATLFALKELDVRGIVLDCGAQQQKAPGSVPVRQMLRLTDRSVPYAIGLASPLQSPEDRGLDQPADYQGGVELILTALRQSSEPVTLFTTGSLRDVAAALNREPDLLLRKVARLYVNAGNPATGTLSAG